LAHITLEVFKHPNCSSCVYVQDQELFNWILDMKRKNQRNFTWATVFYENKRCNWDAVSYFSIFLYHFTSILLSPYLSCFFSQHLQLWF